MLIIRRRDVRRGVRIFDPRPFGHSTRLAVGMPPVETRPRFGNYTPKLGSFGLIRSIASHSTPGPSSSAFAVGFRSYRIGGRILAKPRPSMRGQLS